ncbi:LuxR C-terminal-related transcriptional regulator [Streptomyces halstedii]|uniref:LuxR C-terminal-related transcriptional regulator n=1 Tax=Streptomyces halstedii TaxID=1944 RepID=UPI0036761C03
MTEATVKRHLSNVFEKLGAVSRVDAVNKAKSMLIPRFSRKTGPYLRPEVRLEMWAGTSSRRIAPRDSPRRGAIRRSQTRLSM